MIPSVHFQISYKVLNIRHLVTSTFYEGKKIYLRPWREVWLEEFGLWGFNSKLKDVWRTFKSKILSMFEKRDSPLQSHKFAYLLWLLDLLLICLNRFHEASEKWNSQKLSQELSRQWLLWHNMQMMLMLNLRTLSCNSSHNYKNNINIPKTDGVYQKERINRSNLSKYKELTICLT